jgi:hypothetical protein
VDELRRLRKEIVRCQWLAANITDVKTVARLKEYIKELEEKERELKDK